MMKNRIMGASLTLAVMATGANAAPTATTVPAAEKAGSLYLQCDGAPNNMSTGGAAARLIGAVTLLALFAPPPEEPDAAKRKFGAEGAAACTAVLDGDKAEGNATRRIELILARGLHRIESKDYAAALADAALAQAEATRAGLTADPYFARSLGRSADLLEAAARYRQGDLGGARSAALRSVAATPHSYLPLATVPLYMLAAPSASEEERKFLRERTRTSGRLSGREAERLDRWRDFTGSARIWDAMVDFDRFATPDGNQSIFLASAALAHGLAGNADVAAERATAARANFDGRRAAGKPEEDATAIVELMDLYAIVETATRDAKAARRLFAARSAWPTASVGTVAEVARRLRTGASPDELIGGLATSPDALEKQADDLQRAEVLEKDKGNKELFWLIRSLTNAGAYESVSKRVWRTDKSAFVVAAKKPRPDNLEILYQGDLAPDVALDAYALHAALLAKARGHDGFIISPILNNNVVAALFMTGNRNAPGFPDVILNDADAVIADLRQVIPDPETLKIRAAADKGK